MSSKKTSKRSRTSPLDSDLARKIWLAGIGAYDRMSSEAQDRASKFAADASETFDELVAKGEEVEAVVRARIARSARGKKVATVTRDITSKAQKIGQQQAELLQDSLGKAHKVIGDALAPWNVVALGQAVDQLSKRFESLEREVKSLRAKKAKSMPARAAASKSTAKP